MGKKKLVIFYKTNPCIYKKQLHRQKKCDMISVYDYTKNVNWRENNYPMTQFMVDPKTVIFSSREEGPFKSIYKVRARSFGRMDLQLFISERKPAM